MFWTGKPDGKMWPAKREVYGMLHALQVKDFHFQPLNFPIIQRRCGPKGYILYVLTVQICVSFWLGRPI